MTDVRRIVINRLKELGWSKYRLAKAVRPHMSNTAVYSFLAKTSSINSDLLGPILDALELEIRPRSVRAPDPAHLVDSSVRQNTNLDCGKPRKGRRRK